MPKVRTPRVTSITDLVRPMERLAAFHLVEHGIPARLVAGAAARFGISKERLVEVLGISRPTLNRLEREGGSFDVVTGDVFKDVVVLDKALAMLGHNKQPWAGGYGSPCPRSGGLPSISSRPRTLATWCPICSTAPILARTRDLSPSGRAGASESLPHWMRGTPVGRAGSGRYRRQDDRGRWNHIDPPMVYASSSIALAVLETLVHTNARRFPLNRFVIEVDIPDSLFRGRRVLSPSATGHMGFSPRVVQDQGFRIGLGRRREGS